MTKGIYPVLVGLFFGVVQTGLYLQLTVTLSSSFGTYLMITLCWLVGSAAGVTLLARTRLPTLGFLLLAVAGYFACVLLLAAAPFESGLWPLYAVLIVLTGVYPGVFFARAAPFYRAAALFFRENNGFILGLIVATLGFLLLGRVALWGLPVALAVLIAVLPPQMQR